jgi:lysophospholipase L1-like esterase
VASWFAFNYDSGAGVGNAGNQLMCFDLSSFSACPGQPFTVQLGDGSMSTNAYPPPAVAVISADVIIPANLGGNDELACFNGATLSSCGGAWPVSLDSGYDSQYGAPYPLMSAAGAITGLCLPTGTDPCYSLDGTSAPTPSAMPSAIPGTSGWNGPAFTLGPRVYVPDGNADAVDCYDYSTQSGCANFPVSLPNLGLLYTVNGDPQRPSCIWVNSDDGSGQIQNFDAYTGGACAGGPIRVLASSLVGGARSCVPGSYTSLQVTSPGRSAYSDGNVTFQDEDGNPIPDAGQVPLDATGTAALGGLALSTQAGLPEFVITLDGTSGAPTAVSLKLTWSSPGAYDPACVNGGGAYIALGDSYSSGEGNFPFLSGTDTSKGQPNNKCHRSTFSYPFQLNLDLGYFASRFSFHACSGAVIRDMFRPNSAGNIDLTTGLTEPRQLSWLSGDVGQNASLVTLTIGGNDAHFSDVMTTCVENAIGEFGNLYARRPTGNDCEARWTPTVNAAIAAMGARSGPESLSALYANIAAAAPHARIVVIGYPRFFPPSPPAMCATGWLDTSFPREHMRWIDSEIQSMDNTISGAVASLHNPRVLYASAYNVFAGHERCTSDPWLHGVTSVTNSNVQVGSFHPTAAGQQALARLVEHTLHVF